MAVKFFKHLRYTVIESERKTSKAPFSRRNLLICQQIEFYLRTMRLQNFMAVKKMFRQSLCKQVERFHSRFENFSHECSS